MNICALIILDGFGYTKKKNGNAIRLAAMPMFNYLLKKYKHCTLAASGDAVGLLAGLAGNSQVGHLTIGSGQIIKQPVKIVHDAIHTNTIAHNAMLIKNLLQLTRNGGNLHIIGLLSDAGIHSNKELLYDLIRVARKEKINTIFIHAILDGRDTPPISALYYLQELTNYISTKKNVRIASISGRFYAMDRDNNWSRTKKFYDCLTQEQPSTFSSAEDAINYYYQHGTTDEFILPTQLVMDGFIQSGDGVIFFNTRPDRATQITKALTAQHFTSFKRTQHPAIRFFITPFQVNNCPTTVLFKQRKPTQTIMDWLHKKKIKSFSIAETEKYAHITYFFRGGREKPYRNEAQLLIPSIKSKNYIKHPCMSAPKITRAVVHALQENKYQFFVINYANPDMVGHSGDLSATIKAVECIDKQLEKLYEEVVIKRHGTLFITGDHGNCEEMIDKHGMPKTAHTTNPVYFIAVNTKKRLDLTKMHSLKDIKKAVINELS